MRIAWFLAVVVVATACTSSGDGSDAPAQVPDPVTFCADWHDAYFGGSNERAEEVLGNPPAEIADAAADAVQAFESGNDVAGDAAIAEVTQWVDVNCEPGAAQPGAKARDRRFAPPRGEAFESLLFCTAGAGIPYPESTAHVVMYGDTSTGDPYAGPMVAVVWGGEASYRGDGDPTPVTVRGTQGVAAPITVFQQVVLDELGTVIAWDEGDEPVGLYGRYWDASRTADLVALADALEVEDGAFSLPADVLPEGYEQVYAGTDDPMYLVFALGSQYEVRYQHDAGEGALLRINGFVASPEEFEAVRFLAPGLQPTTIGDHDALAGGAWTERGPAVVTWREPDGLVVRLTGVGIDLDIVEEVAAAMRELTRSEWVDLIETPDECPAPSP